MFNPRSAVITLGTLAGSALFGFLGGSAFAQTSAADLQPWEGGGQTDADSSLNNPLSGRSGTGSSSIFDLINRIQSLQGQSNSEFARNQDKNFNNAVEDYQKKQQEAIDSLPED